MEIQPIRVFIADDHPLLRIGLRLAFEGIETIAIVGESDNGFETIEKIQKTVPDVALIDIDMPGLSGIPAIRVLRKAFPAMKLLALSTYNDTNYIKDAMKAGADGYVLKTIDIDGLAGLIAAFHAGRPIVSPYLVNLSADVETEPPAPGRDLDSLTHREKQILKLVSEGKNNKEISDALYLSVQTVKTHVKNIFKKLNVSSRFEAAILARESGLFA
ncbi:response regulator transcription factor [Solidesulfovibrio sp.]|uniref:response regulator n=1 Tax=Solidesulfovibrio sp. TaxID=2910990 RepID=UPI0026349FB1|nr:response regulator transcription factor [Solidesulfovibrio sp.]